MKKLMIALASVASLAFVSKADIAAQGTSFEGLSTNEAFNVSWDDAGGSSGLKYWSGTTAGTVYAFANVGETAYAGSRPAAAPGANLQALNLDTEGARLYRNINAGDNPAAVDVTANTVLFDSVVQFTASSEDPTPEDGDKLIVWLKGDDEGGPTNLIVTAGYLSNGSSVASNYVAAINGITDFANADGWHRLTIKALPVSGSLGFVVFVDGTNVTCSADKGFGDISSNGAASFWNSDGALFPSLVAAGATGAQSLTSVGFAGTGKLDDVYFTSTVPDFAQESASATISWGEGVASVTYQFGEGTPYDAVNGDTIPMEGGSITITATYDTGNGYEAGTWAVNGAVLDSGTTYTVATGASATFTINAVQKAFSVGGTTYPTLADAITAAGGGTVTLVGNVREVIADNDEGGDNFTLDLAGKSIIADGSQYEDVAVITVNGTMTIIDSVGGGVVTNTAESGEFAGVSLQVFGSATIGSAVDQGATFAGTVQPEEDSTFTVIRGKFGQDVSTYVDSGSTQTGPTGGYYVVAPSAPAPTPSYITIAQNPWYTSTKAVVLAENLPGQTGNIVSAFHGQGEGEYLGLTYSTNPLHFDLFTVDGTDEPTTVTSVDAEDLTTPGFRGVAISKTLGVAVTLAYATTTTMYAFPLAGGTPTAVTKPGTHSFDSAAFSPDGKYLFSNALNGETSNQFYVKWSVAVDAETGALSLTEVGSISAGGRGRNLAYARINGRDLVFALADTGKVVTIDMTGDDASAWSANNLVTDLPAHSYGSLCVSGVNATNALGEVVAPHLTVAASKDGADVHTDVLNVYALTVPASGAVTASLTTSFDEAAMTAVGFGDISDASRYGNTVYVTEDEKTIYFARPDNKLYAAQFAYVVDFVVDGVTNSVSVFEGKTAAQADPTKENYVFDGWFLPGAGEAYDLSTPVTQNLTLTAQFTVAEAKVGNTPYATLAGAVAAANAGDTVTVLKDCTVTTSVSFTKNITVSNDYTIAANVNYALCIGATVTFEGSGMIQRGSTITGSAFCVGANETTRGTITAGTAGTLIFNGGTVCGGSGGNLIKLENGTVEMNGGILKDGLRGIKADADKGSYTSTIVINGGTITNCSAYAVYASAESATGTATITINGGVIAGPIGKAGQVGTESITIPSTSTAKFDRDQTAFCVTGYETTLDNGWYVVTAIPPSGFDGGASGATFSIPAETQATIAPVLETLGKELADVADTASGMTYAQAYALGLLNTTTGDVDDLNATIEVVGDKVKVSLDTTVGSAYTVTLKVYEKASLTDIWPTEPTQTYALGSATETNGFTPVSDEAGFYKVEVVITDK